MTLRSGSQDHLHLCFGIAHEGLTLRVALTSNNIPAGLISVTRHNTKRSGLTVYQKNVSEKREVTFNIFKHSVTLKRHFVDFIAAFLFHFAPEMFD